MSGRPGKIPGAAARRAAREARYWANLERLKREAEWKQWAPFADSGTTHGGTRRRRRSRRRRSRTHRRRRRRTKRRRHRRRRRRRTRR